MFLLLVSILDLFLALRVKRVWLKGLSFPANAEESFLKVLYFLIYYWSFCDLIFILFKFLTEGVNPSLESEVIFFPINILVHPFSLVSKQ